MDQDKQTKIVAPRLPREVITALVNIMGEEWVGLSNNKLTVRSGNKDAIINPS
ncbi:MAG: hypothetical protein JRJ00_01170 [Deltaproteobacteria bacterium]|nr:hypothetical protein [Deltaproteobacteria bacterium]